MIITKEWLNKHKTANGAWTAKQFKCLGLSWPATKGWQKRLIGTKITTSNKGAFEHLAGEPAKDKINVQDQEHRIKRLEYKLNVVLANLDIVFDD